MIQSLLTQFIVWQGAKTDQERILVSSARGGLPCVCFLHNRPLFLSAFAEFVWVRFVHIYRDQHLGTLLYIFFTSKINPQSTSWRYCKDVIIVEMTDNTNEQWQMRTGTAWGTELMVEIFWLPSEPPVASARWLSWKRVCVGRDISLIMSLLTWGCIWCIKSLFMLPLCERQPLHFLNV